jgi:nitric oxide reductase subunit B
MADAETGPMESLSSWWKVAALATMAAGFAVLILLTVKAYQNAPPIPDSFVDPAGGVVFTAGNVIADQQVFLKHGLMDNGTIWGHGGYLGPDFSAQSLHILALDLADRIARERLSRGYAHLTPEETAAVDGAVALDLKANRYDPASGTLALPAGAAESFNRLVEYWTRYFREPESNGGLARETVSHPQELRQLTAFFAWAAWASAATRPGTSHSYTNNLPYEPLAGNTPTPSALLYSALSLVFLLGGTAAVLLAFGKFDYLGWHRRSAVGARAAALPVSDAQRATLKFMSIAALLFFGQTLIGGGVAHYRADPGSFYGIDLARLLPSNLLRTWHLQLAILWIATAYVGGALFVAGMLGRSEPSGQRRAIHLLFAAIFVVALGSLLGEWAGLLQWLGDAWFWFGNQGWEYLEIGRFWQILLAIGLIFWFGLLWRAVAPAWRDSEQSHHLLLDRRCGDPSILPSCSVF